MFQKKVRVLCCLITIANNNNYNLFYLKAKVFPYKKCRRATTTTKKAVHQFVTVLKLLLSAYVCLPLLFVATTIIRVHASNRMKETAKRNFETRATRWSIINLANVSAMIIYFHTVQLQLRCITPSFSFDSAYALFLRICFFFFFVVLCKVS